MKVFDIDIQAAIFDLDGTLLDSTSLWKDIDKAFFRRRNMEVPKDYAKNIIHLGLEETAIYTKNTFNLKDSPEEILNEWRNASLEAYTYHLCLKAGAKEFLEKLYNGGVILAVATANAEELYAPCLKRQGIDRYFNVVMDTKNVKEGKQSPRLYKEISHKLGVEPSRTMVFEDIAIGLKTAKESGYITIGIDDINSKDDEVNKRKYSDFYITDFSEIK